MKATYEMPNGTKLYMWGDDRFVQLQCDVIYKDELIKNIKKNLAEIVEKNKC